MAAIKLYPEEMARWEANLKLSSRKPKTAPSQTPPKRRKEALKLYRQTGSKGYVCGKLHMGRDTLNKILEAAGVV
ncbi:hypothetical protein V7O66_03325 [Methanolobus sp. ZRKC3]|uniref:hypothetical protein n=1 Tax=Methanolobus sp. ZRKC3 TaxID=3125786 RepID=UPI00324CA39A